MGDNLSFNYTSASVVAILGAIAAVAVSFGLHLTQDNIHSVLTLSGLVLGAVAAGGGAKTAGLIHANVQAPTWLHFTPATLVSAVGAAISLAVSFGLHLTQQNISSIETLVGLVAAGIMIGGGVKSGAMLRAGIHPAQRR